MSWTESSIELISIKCNDNNLENLFSFSVLFCFFNIEEYILKIDILPGNVSYLCILLCFDWHIPEPIGEKCSFLDSIYPWKALKNKKQIREKVRK